MEVLLIYTTSAVCTTDTSIIGTCQQLHHYYNFQHTTYHYHLNHTAGGSTTNTIASTATSSAISFCTTVMALSPHLLYCCSTKTASTAINYSNCGRHCHCHCHCTRWHWTPSNVSTTTTIVSVLVINATVLLPSLQWAPMSLSFL